MGNYKIKHTLIDKFLNKQVPVTVLPAQCKEQRTRIVLERTAVNGDVVDLHIGSCPLKTGVHGGYDILYFYAQGFSFLGF